MLSEWCIKEWECARDAGIPIVVIVDIDKWPSRPLIKSYIEAGYGYLFSSQVISFSTAHRKGSYSMIAAAIDEAVDHVKAVAAGGATASSTAKTATKKPIKKKHHHSKKLAKPSGETIHEGNLDTEMVDEQLRQKIKEKWGNVTEFFDDATKGDGDGISRKEWKAALQRLGMDLSDGECVLFGCVCVMIIINYD
jgi:hypothetical protein